MVIIEEHHELVLELFRRYGLNSKITVINYDNHSDLFSPLLNLDSLKVNDNFVTEKSLKKIVYSSLRVSDYIIFLFYLGIIKKLVWVNNEKINRNFFVSLIENNDYYPYTKLSLSTKKTSDKEIIFLSSELHHLLSFRDEIICVSIDLDFFWCNDFKGESVTVEVTKEEYIDFYRNKYHTLRLSYGQRCKMEKYDGKYFLSIYEFPKKSKKKPNISIIISKLDILIQKILEERKNIDLIVICKSVISGYMDQDLANQIINYLKARLEGEYYDID
ncbi:UPF0489 family protein [Ignavigranum ruoffiae]|uniref:UPF0489 family protein n=1 Tax=Ignavigranum ruoffiae TaxID=89093 RepID=UPI0024AD4C32|nr:UPF0489 family protein [Ignavigranum ruoffiae]